MLIFILLLYIIISELLPWLRKNNFTTSNRVNNTCGEVGVQSSDALMNLNAEVLQQGANRWVC